jgi:capsular exopolysaccharide synthesis family protein
LDLRRLLAIVRAWGPLLIAAPIVAGATAFAVSSLQDKVYEGQTTLIVGQSLSAANPDYTQLLVAQGLSETYASIAETRPILDGVIETLRLEDDAQSLAERLEVSAPGGTSFLIIKARDTNPARAAAIANEVGSQLIAASPAIQGVEQSDLQASIEEDLIAIRSLIQATQARYQTLVDLEDRTPAQEAQLPVLEERLTSLRATYAALLGYTSGGASNILAVVEPAAAPNTPVAPTILLNTLLASMLGLIVVAGIAFVTTQLDDSIKDSEAVREVAGMSNLGTIGQMRGDRGQSEIYRLVTLLYPRSTTAEAFRTLRVNVEFSSLDAPVQTLLVTSATPGEGKSVTASNLAVVFAQAGRSVLLVDADLRSPSVQKYFDLPNVHGLTTLLRGEVSHPGEVAQATEQQNLRVITTGPLPPNPAEQLGSHRMQTVVGTLRESADIVIFDSPPLLAVADAAVLSAFADGTLLVIDAARSRRRQVRIASGMLTRAGAKILGAVLNRVRVTDSFHYAGNYGGADPSSAADVNPPSPSPDRARLS